MAGCCDKIVQHVIHVMHINTAESSCANEYVERKMISLSVLVFLVIEAGKQAPISCCTQNLRLSRTQSVGVS